VLALLEDARLPTTDIVSTDEPRMWVLEEEGAVVGAIALERFGSEALLRSLVVAQSWRKQGLGVELVAHLEACARSEQIDRLVLLTETAAPFFCSLGYAITDRGEVSEPLKHSAEFRSLCPASATCLSKTLAKASR